MENLSNEIWKDIEELNNMYQISNFGNIKGKARLINIRNNGQRLIHERIISPQDNGNGYKQLSISIKRKRYIFYIHRLVAKYFIKNPDMLNVVNHKNHDRSDNHFTNLEWCDTKYNINYSKHLMRNNKRYTSDETAEKIKKDLF